ncbi:MAG: NAD-dependent epimerase/dehydratase family protein, partial [Sphingomonadales bacterium]
YTDLLDPGFATGLADHAAAVAERYPWVMDWTPVNEPVTTARFAALYGHWYPHQRDEASFWIALLNQIDGTRLAMRAVRRINPTARLIQTEDLGRTYATVEVRDQAAFDNVRRWMSWDLLCGRVVPGHPLWRRVSGFGLEERLRTIADDPCPPDVIGVNHYLTSDRFLDHRVASYPAGCRGDNGRQRFVDVEAVRVLQPPVGGLGGALREAWQRYGIPLAVTEVHNGSTREEQMRWMLGAWQTAERLRDEGVDVRAVTSWALLGSKGWNTLLTSPGLYEPGAYDVSGGKPRATALVPLLQNLSGMEPGEFHPVLQGHGWWQRPIRLHHAAVSRPARAREHVEDASGSRESAAPILIVGATGTLGGALAAACRHRDLHHVVTGRDELDLSDAASIGRTLDRYKPWSVINAAGWVRVDEAETQEQACFEANAAGAARLARACAERGIHSSSFSSDLVFGQEGTRPYRESDRPAPRSAYGRSKAAMEDAAAALPGKHLIVRT